MQPLNSRKKLLFISNMASPYWVKLCYLLQKHVNAEFIFYEHVHKNRPAFWKMPLGDKCHVLKKPLFTFKRKYITFSHLKIIKRFNPDIVMTGGLTIPANWIAHIWAKKNGKKTILMSEFWRTRSGKIRSNYFLKLIVLSLYKNVDAVFAVGKHGKDYFEKVIGFPSYKVHEVMYPNDIDTHLAHELRKPKKAYTYLFPHHLSHSYNPLMAIHIFRKILNRYPGSKLLMNTFGLLHESCEKLIKELELSNDVEFLDNIKSWNELHKVYLRADISLSPAHNSNGSMAIREAMASGMGIILSDRIKIDSKLIRENGSGFVCDLNIDSFLQAVESYINNPSLLQKHGTINKKITKHFSIADTTKHYAKLIEQHVLK